LGIAKAQPFECAGDRLVNCRKCGANRPHLYFTDDGALACIKCGNRDYKGAEVEKIMEVTGIKIEKGVPLPRVQVSGSKYPFVMMQPGDSFFLKEVKLNSTNYHLTRANKNLKPKRFSARTVDGGVRVWRVY